MDLKAVYDSLDDIPESVDDFRSLFVEKEGKYELAKIDGLKTAGDVDRLQEGIRKERAKTEEIKSKLKVFAGSTLGVDAPVDKWREHYESITSKLDRFDELEAAADGKLDEAKIADLVAKRAETTVKTKTAPLERTIEELRAEREQLIGTNQQLSQAVRERRLEDRLAPIFAKAKVVDTARPDAALLARMHFEETEDGQFLTREGVDGVTPGRDPEGWLSEMLQARPHWLPPSIGGGSRGTGANGVPIGQNNPWSRAHWNVTNQGKFIREHGMERAEAAARSAGTKVGATGPAPEPQR